MTADFNAYDKNYREFEVGLIEIGMSIEELQTALRMTGTVVEAGEDYKVLQFEKWRAVAGPDLLEKKLLVKTKNGLVSSFKVVNEMVEVNPW